MTQMAGAAAPDRRLCPLGRGACRRRVGGFTLVELLVALAAMALLSAMAWRGIDAMGRAQSSTQAFGADVQALQAGLGQWTSDLDAVAVMPAVTSRLPDASRTSLGAPASPASICSAVQSPS